MEWVGISDGSTRTKALTNDESIESNPNFVSSLRRWLYVGLQLKCERTSSEQRNLHKATRGSQVITPRAYLESSFVGPNFIFYYYFSRRIDVFEIVYCNALQGEFRFGCTRIAILFVFYLHIRCITGARKILLKLLDNAA